MNKTGKQFLIINCALCFVLGFLALKIFGFHFNLAPNEPATKSAVTDDYSSQLKSLGADADKKVASFASWTYEDYSRNYKNLDFFDRRYVLKKLIIQDPKASWNYLNENKANIQDLETFRRIALTEMASRGDAGFATSIFKDDVLDSKDLENRYWALITGWMRSDFPNAMQFLKANYEHTKDYPILYQAIFVRMMQTKGLDVAMNWLDELSGNVFKQTLQVALPVLYQKNPDKTMKWLVARAGIPEISHALIPIIKHYASYNPDATLNLISTMPDGNSKWNSIVTASMVIARQAPDKLDAWIPALSNQAYRDIANGEYAKVLMEINLTDALGRLDLIKSKSLKDRYATVVINEAFAKKPQELKEAMAALKLSDVIKAAYRTILSHAPKPKH